MNGPWDGGASVSHVGQAKGGWESFPQMLGVVMSSNWGVHYISLQAETAYLQLPLPPVLYLINALRFQVVAVILGNPTRS